MGDKQAAQLALLLRIELIEGLAQLLIVGDLSRHEIHLPAGSSQKHTLAQQSYMSIIDGRAGEAHDAGQLFRGF
jgi:hypothetical protein